MAERRAEPRGVVVSPHERDARLLHQVFDDIVAARAAIPAIAVEHDFTDGEIADHARREMDQVEHTAAADEFIHNRGDVYSFPCSKARFVQHLDQQFAVFLGEDLDRVAHGVAPRQHAHDFEHVGKHAMRELFLRLRVGHRHFKTFDNFSRIEKQVQEVLKVLRVHLAERTDVPPAGGVCRTRC